MNAFKYNIYKAFFICEIDDTFKNFKKLKLDHSHYMYISDDTDYYTENNNFELHLMGYCLDIRDSEKSESDILTVLSRKNSVDEIYQELEYINGRYTIVIREDDEHFISSDANSLKPIFYSEKVGIISSHEYIIRNMAARQEIKLELNPAYKRGFLDLTPYIGIYKLNCSNDISLTTYNIRRLFPRSSRTEKAVGKATNELFPYFDNMIEWIKRNRRNTVFSLTGGVDSRSSLAVLKPIIDEVKSFTYLRPNKDLKNKAVRIIYTNDEKIVASIAENLNLNHEFFYIQKKNEDKEYYDYINTIASSNHSFPLSKYLNDHDEFKNALHVKSTVQAIAKTTYPIELYKKNDFSAMVKSTLHWGSDKLRNASKEEVRSVYEGYMERVKLDLNDLSGYDILDIMYMECRMGHFQSIITQETDNTLEVFNFVNTRKFFEILFSVPILEREKRNTHKAIVQHYWPVLNQFGINTDQAFIQSTEVESNPNGSKNDIVNGIEIVKTNNISLSKNKGLVQIKPEKTPLLMESQYLISLINTMDSERKINISSTYKNENGRENIKIEIDSKEYDILDLNDTAQIVLGKNKQCTIKYKFLTDKKNESWLNASKVMIKISK